MNSKKYLFPSLFVCAVFALILRLFAKPVSAKPTASSTSYAAIDTYIEEQMRRLKIPGVALAIVEGDQIVYQHGFGRARPGGEAPSPQTPFVLGSTTKSFTALAVMQLVEAGKIELDAPVQRYLPWFRVADAQASARITVRHLLHQTSALPGVPGMINMADLDQSPEAAERQMRALSTLKLTRPVGKAFEYSNLNYNLLGLIIEAASDASYPTYIQEHIFAPLHMSHSYTSQALAQQNGLAVGHRYWFAAPFAVTNLAIARGSLAAGELISSAEDMAHYLIAHLNEGRYGAVQILSAAGMAELQRGATRFLEMGVDMGEYGMGWAITDIGQTKAVWHTGNVPDFSSYTGLLPAQKKGVVLLVNADNFGLPPVLTEVGFGVTALLAGQQPPPLELAFLPWVMRALLLIPLLQIVGVASTLRQVRRWRRDPNQRPSRGRLWGQHILLPLIPNLSLATLWVYLLVSGLIRFTWLFLPDVSWIALICGSFAGMWSFLRTGLLLRASNQPLKMGAPTLRVATSTL